MGIDLATINYKMIILTVLLSYVPDWILYPDWNKELEEKKIEVTSLQKEENTLRKKITDQNDIQKKLDAYNKQIEVLKARSSQVEKIIDKRSNPKDSLERLGRDIPEDMWFNSLAINDSQIEILGSSYNFKSISDFITKVNSSIYYNKSLEVVDSKTGVMEYFGKTKRIESFKLKGTINFGKGNSNL